MVATHLPPLRRDGSYGIVGLYIREDVRMNVKEYYMKHPVTGEPMTEVRCHDCGWKVRQYPGMPYRHNDIDCLTRRVSRLEDRL